MKYTILSIVLLITAIAQPAFSKEAKRPNVVIVITDDQGYGDLAFTGNPAIKTPSIDKLRSQGTLLNNFHVDPTCAPTRSALTFSPADPPAPPNSPTPSPLGQNGWLSLKGHLVERVEDDLGEAMKRRQRVRRIRRAAHVLC